MAARTAQGLAASWAGVRAMRPVTGLPATGLGAYLITRDLAARLLPAMLPVTRRMDHERDRIHVHDFRHFGLEPFPSHVDDGKESTFTVSGFADVRKFCRYRRLPVYGLRCRNSLGRLVHLAARGRLRGAAPRARDSGRGPPRRQGRRLVNQPNACTQALPLAG